VLTLAQCPENVQAREIVATTSPDETLARIESVLARWNAGQRIDALGIASFGPIDVDRSSATYGHVLATPKPGWARTNVGRRLQRSLGVPTVFDTDVNAAALAEISWGSGRGFDDFAYVTVGTGIGVGLIVAGKPTRGFGHCELGHIRVPRPLGDDWPGSCPYHGDCVEGMASGSALRARHGEDLDKLDADHPVWEGIAWTLAQLCQVIVCAAAPGRIAIGGGVIDHQPHLLPKIEQRLVESLNGFIRLPADRPYVRAPELGADAGPLGAIALAMQAGPSHQIVGGDLRDRS
jgi:fructokinase